MVPSPCQGESVPEPNEISHVIEDVVDIFKQINLEVYSVDVQDLLGTDKLTEINGHISYFQAPVRLDLHSRHTGNSMKTIGEGHRSLKSQSSDKDP
ncbi:hypothetical protein TNCV_3111181 [Trichonephila clavipes]|nr:hypothetical protein TNCV_3111181 [Trichonephila clavipes]